MQQLNVGRVKKTAWKPDPDFSTFPLPMETAASVWGVQLVQSADEDNLSFKNKACSSVALGWDGFKTKMHKYVSSSLSFT